MNDLLKKLLRIWLKQLFYIFIFVVFFVWMYCVLKNNNIVQKITRSKYELVLFGGLTSVITALNFKKCFFNGYFIYRGRLWAIKIKLNKSALRCIPHTAG